MRRPIHVIEFYSWQNPLDDNQALVDSPLQRRRNLRVLSNEQLELIAHLLSVSCIIAELAPEVECADILDVADHLILGVKYIGNAIVCLSRLCRDPSLVLCNS